MPRSRLPTPALALLGCLACTPSPRAWMSPEMVVHTWFEAHREADADELRAMVEPACRDHPVAHGGPARVLGAPVLIDEVDLEREHLEGDRAVVSWRIDGAVRTADLDPELDVLGTTLTLGGDALDVVEYHRRGRFELRHLTEGWFITCDREADADGPAPR